MDAPPGESTLWRRSQCSECGQGDDPNVWRRQQAKRQGTRSFATREMSCTTWSRMSTSRKRTRRYYDEAEEWPEDEMDEIDIVGCDDEDISAEMDEASIGVEDAYINYLERIFEIRWWQRKRKEAGQGTWQKLSTTWSSSLCLRSSARQRRPSRQLVIQ